MITYQTLENGDLSGAGYTIIPKGHPLYAQALAQAEAGEATIEPYVEPEMPFGDFEAALTRTYAAAMNKALNGYSLEETVTWGEKREASKARLAGTDDALDRVSLAKIAGVINGAMFLTPENVTELDAGLTADDLAAVDATAVKIHKARIRFNTWTGEIERLRDKHWLAGKENGPATYQAEIDGLVADYAALEAAANGA